MTEEEFEDFWELQANTNQVVGKLQSLLARVDLDASQLDDVTQIIKDSNECIDICKKNIRSAAVD